MYDTMENGLLFVEYIFKILMIVLRNVSNLKHILIKCLFYFNKDSFSIIIAFWVLSDSGKYRLMIFIKIDPLPVLLLKLQTSSIIM